MLIRPYSLLLAAVLIFVISCNNKKEETSPELIDNNRDSLAPRAMESTANPYATVDVSPMDMSYYPVDYPKLKMTKSISGPPHARLIYSRPRLMGRPLFPDLLKESIPWRLGANEVTEIELYNGATIQGKNVKPGTYALYCIPHKDQWTIAFNANIESWGLTPDSTMDLYRFNIPVLTTARRIEFFTMVFEKITGGAELVMAWDNMEARLPMKFE